LGEEKSGGRVRREAGARLVSKVKNIPHPRRFDVRFNFARKLCASKFVHGSKVVLSGKNHLTGRTED